MKTFRVRKGAKCLAIETRSAYSFVDISGMLEEKTCSRDKVFCDHELVADYVRCHNMRHHLAAYHNPVERYVAENAQTGDEFCRLYAFQRGDWVAFYSAIDVEVMC